MSEVILPSQKMRYKDKLEFKIDVDPYITHVPIIRLVRSRSWRMQFIMA